MKQLILILLIFPLLCQENETQQQKRVFLVETNMTREQLESLINQGEAAKFEEGKLASFESKTEKEEKDDDEDDDKKQKNEQKESANTTLLKKNTKQKISFFNYVFAFLIVVVLLNLYVYGSQRKRLMKANNYSKNSLNEYILLDNHVC